MIERARRQGRRIAMNFGSSRSLVFYAAPTRKQLASDPFLSPREKDFLDRWELVNNAYPGASLLTSYVRFTQWTDHGLRPDAVLVELDPALMNGRTRWSVTELKFGVPVAFAVDHALQMPWEHFHTILGSRLFAMSRYRLGRSESRADVWDEAMRQLSAASTAERDENLVLSHGFVPGAEPPLQRMIFLRASQILEVELFAAFRIDPNLARYAQLIAERCRELGIPLFFWSPPQHPAWREVAERSVDPTQWERLERSLGDRGAHFLRLNQTGRMHCNEYIDPIHFAQSCAPEAAARLIYSVEATMGRGAFQNPPQ